MAITPIEISVTQHFNVLRNHLLLITHQILVFINNLNNLLLIMVIKTLQFSKFH